MSLHADCDPAYTEAYALAEKIVGWLMGWGKRTKPEYNRRETSSENMSVRDGRKITRGPLDEGESQASVEVSGDTKQTKPECHRKKGTYKNISKARGWLRATVSSLLN